MPSKCLHLDFVVPLPEAEAGSRQRVLEASAVLARYSPARGQFGAATHAAALRRLCAACPAQSDAFT